MNNQQRHIDLAWLVGDWQTLANTEMSDLVDIPNTQEYALKIAVAHYQLGNPKKALSCVQWAQGHGVSEIVLTKYLISSVYQTLAQAKLSAGQPRSAAALLDQAAQVLDVDNAEEPDWLSRIRLKQCERMVSPHSQSKSIEVTTKSVLELGQAWAGNTINTVIFRHQGIFSHQGHQYTAFYVDNQTLRLVKRNLDTNELEHYDLHSDYNTKDAHNTISLGIDRDGHLHMTYDHHGNRLNYRRSLEPFNIQAWSDSLPMTGVNEERVTYPAFILPTKYTSLLMLYRDGNWKQGTAYLKYYDEALARWFDYPNSILSGAEQKPWTSNAYWNHPAMDKNGVLHLSYTWRTGYFSDEQLINNVNIGYAKSYDGGFSWYTSQHKPYRLPITPTNTEVAQPIPPGSNNMNQTSMALDSKGHPHIVFYANDSNSIPQYQHLWFDGSTWQTKQVSQRTAPFALVGGGTLEVPISRPEIVIDDNDTVFVIYRSEETQQKLVASYQTAPDYVCQPNNTIVLWDEQIGQAEPMIDRIRWQQDKTLTLLVQYNDQPDGDVKHEAMDQLIFLVDIEFTNI